MLLSSNRCVAFAFKSFSRRGIVTEVNGLSRRCNSVFNSSYEHQLTSRRHFGIGDSLMGMAAKKVQNSREKEFASMITVMAETPKWTLRPWKVTVEKQLNSWSMYVPGQSTTPEMLEMKRFKDILDVMTVHEIDNPDSLTGLMKERIYKASGMGPTEVSRLLFVYKQSLVVHTWLQEKKKNNETMPATQEEMMEMQSSDPRLRTIGMKIMTPAGKAKTGRGRGTPY